MKNNWILILTILVTGMFPKIALSDSVHVKGRWGGNIIRTIVPQEPRVSLDGNVLSVYCADALSNLTIVVIDAESHIIMEECVVIYSGETIHFVLDEAVGVYNVYLNHEYGYLMGDFLLY